MKYFLCLLLVLPCILAMAAEEEHVEALGSAFDADQSLTSVAKRAYCPGTQCGNFCIPNIRFGVCCGNSGNACPNGTICCGNPYRVRPWCCKRFQRCSSQYNMFSISESSYYLRTVLTLKDYPLFRQ